MLYNGSCRLPVELLGVLYVDRGAFDVECGAFFAPSPLFPLMKSLQKFSINPSLCPENIFGSPPTAPSTDLPLCVCRQRGLTVAFRSPRGPWRDTSSFTPPALVSINVPLIYSVLPEVLLLSHECVLQIRYCISIETTFGPLFQSKGRSVRTIKFDNESRSVRAALSLVG